MDINIEQLYDGTFQAVDMDMYDGAPDGNRVFGRHINRLKAIFELIDNLILEQYPNKVPDTIKCPFCGPNKGSVKSNSDGTIKVPLEFLPCMSCGETGRFKLSREQSYRNYYASKLWDFRKRGLL